jgi:hypothetical protein
MSTDDTTSGDPAHPHETEDSFSPTGESNRQEGQTRERLAATDSDAAPGVQTTLRPDSPAQHTGTDSRPNRQSAHSTRARAQIGES